MARGWESKSVESQIEDAAARRLRAGAASQKQTDTLQQARRRALELDLVRVRGELSRCSNARFRALLEAELRHLEAELRKYSC
jgi:hypothetical protein